MNGAIQQLHNKLGRMSIKDISVSCNLHEMLYFTIHVTSSVASISSERFASVSSEFIDSEDSEFVSVPFSCMWYDLH